MDSDSYEGIRTCNLRVSVMIRGYKKGSRLGTWESPGQRIALLLVAQWLELWCANQAAQVRSWRSKESKAAANHHHSKRDLHAY